MINILIITLIALLAFLLLTGFGIMRDFSRLWLRHSRKVFCSKQGIDYYSELAVTLLVTLTIATSASVLKGAATILVAMVTTNDIAQFTTALRGVFSTYTTELQSSRNHLLLFFLNPALKMVAVLVIIYGIKSVFTSINKKAGGDCYEEADVFYFSSIGVLLLIAIEIVCRIQDIKMANNIGNIAYLLLDKFSYILFLLTLEEVRLLHSNKDLLNTTIDKYLVTNRVEKKMVSSGWKMILLTYATGLLLSLPYFIGLQWIRSNTTLMSAFIIVLGIAILIMKKVFADSFNLLGTVVFASTASEPISIRKPFSNKLRLPVIIGLILTGALLVAFGIAYPKELFMLLLIIAVAVCLMVFGITVIYFLTMCISYIVTIIVKGNTTTSPAEKCFAYIGWVLISLPKAITASAAVVALAFMAITCFPKDINCDNFVENSSVVDANGNWLYIDEEHDHYYAPINYDEVPEFFKKILVIQEDRFFFQQHDLLPNTSNWHGISLSVLRGRGGSNINAQLCKNITFIDADGFPRDLSRKLAEMVSGYMISQKETPENIMERYLNIASFHGTFAGFRGLNASALYAFGKPIGQLNYAQQLYLVNTLPRSIYVKGEDTRIAYNAVQHNPQAVKEALMAKASRWYDEGLISRKEFNAIKREELAFTNCRYKNDIPIGTRIMLEKFFIKYPGRHDCTLTTENENALVAAYNLLKTKDVFRKNNSELQVAALIVEAKTGNIIGHFSSSELVDYANAYTYPIGSIGKPAIILEMLKSGAPLDFKLYDGKVGNRKTPHNSHGWSNRYVGIETILSKSLNAPFANICDLGLSPETVFQNLEKDYGLMKLTQDNESSFDSYNYPLGLKECSVLSVAQIYQTIFNNGVFVPLSLESNPDTVKTIRIWDENHVKVVKNALHQTIESNGGTLHRYKKDLPEGKILYGKTGTSSRQKDFWTVLSDGKIVIVCWASYGKQVNGSMRLGTEMSWGASAAGLFSVLIYNELTKTKQFKIRTL